MLTLLQLKMHLLEYLSPNSNHMKSKTALTTKDTRVTPIPLILCITLETIVECQQATITSKHPYSRILLNIKACSCKPLTMAHQEEVSTKEGVEVVITNSEQSEPPSLII